VAEQLFCKQQVVGSNPTDGSSQLRIAAIAPRCRRGDRKVYGGSSPSAGTFSCPNGSVPPKADRVRARFLLARHNCLDSSVVERFLGKKEVVSPILTQGSKGNVGGVRTRPRVRFPLWALFINEAFLGRTIAKRRSPPAIPMYNRERQGWRERGLGFGSQFRLSGRSFIKNIV
jgi:hypothetical protein